MSLKQENVDFSGVEKIKKLNMNSKLKIVLYGFGVFAVYIVFLIVLRLVSGNAPEDAEIFGMFSRNDFLLGLIVAVVLTFSYVRKKKM